MGSVRLGGCDTKQFSPQWAVAQEHVHSCLPYMSYMNKCVSYHGVLKYNIMIMISPSIFSLITLERAQERIDTRENTRENTHDNTG